MRRLLKERNFLSTRGETGFHAKGRRIPVRRPLGLRRITGDENALYPARRNLPRNIDATAPAADENGGFQSESSREGSRESPMPSQIKHIRHFVPYVLDLHCDEP